MSYKNCISPVLRLQSKRLILLGLIFWISNSSFASGSLKIGKINRAVWPYELRSAEDFDFASKMEMLVFASELNDLEQVIKTDTLAHYLHIRSVNQASIEKWLNNVKQIVVQNFSKIKCESYSHVLDIMAVDNWNDLLAIALVLPNKLPDNLKEWYHEDQKFYSLYAYEQLRLAALFPSVSSEILTFNDSEINGSGFGDKQFLLTFDDGPTYKGGNTDVLISLLNANHKHGVFFVLGDSFNSRLMKENPQNLQNLYQNMDVGSHGKIHKSHPKYADWKYSIDYTDSLIYHALGYQSHYFRPPYGQRSLTMLSYLGAKNTSVMLWNIDSQDWNAKLNATEVADRVITLMLLWRKGVILFHDIHPKAKEALPIIWKELERSSLHWK